MPPKVKVLTPEGILDNSKSITLREQVKESIEEGYKIILIDFEKVSFMDSSGLGTLILIRRIITDKDAKLFLMSLNEQLKVLLELTNTGQYFDILADEAELEAKIYYS